MKRLFAAAALVVGSIAFAQADAGTQTPPAAGAAQPGAQMKQVGGKTQVTWWGHAAFVITTPGGATIAIDPWLENPNAPKGAQRPQNLDAILVTHGHSDHMGQAQDLLKASPNAKLVGSFEIVNTLSGGKDMGANVGGTIKVKDVSITLVEAVHSSGFSTDGKTLQYGGSPMGYIIKIDKGPTLYHAGDTDVFSSMALISERYKPTVAMLPIGGHFTMDPSGAAIAARMLKVKTVVPMHFGTFPMLAGTPAQLQAELKKQRAAAKMVELKPGQTTSL